MLKIKISKDKWENLNKKAVQFEESKVQSPANPDILPLYYGPRKQQSLLDAVISTQTSEDDLKKIAVRPGIPRGILLRILDNVNCTREIRRLVEDNPNYRLG